METKLSNNELIEGIYHNIYSDCQNDNDYEVSRIIANLANDTEATINFLNENITDTGEDLSDMFYEENHFTEQQREIIRNSDAADAYLYAQKLEIFCDLLMNGINAGEENYIRIFNGEDWEEIAREIASE